MRSRTSKATLVLLVSILVLLVRGTRRQRRLFRALNLFGLRYPGEDAVHAIGGFFGGIGGAVKDYVQEVLRVTADALQSGIDWVLSVARSAAGYAHELFALAMDAVWSALDAARGYAASLFWRGIDFANGVLTQAIDWANTIGRWAIDTATSLFHQAIDWANTIARWALDTAASIAHGLFDSAIAFAHWIYDTATSLAHALFDSAMSFAHWIYDTSISVAHSLFDAATSLAHALFDTANDLIGSGLHALHDTLINVIDNVRDTVGDQISTVNDYLFGSVQAIIDLLGEILDWVIALVEFPFTTARDMWGSMRDTGGQTIFDHMPGMVDRWGSHIADHVNNNVTARSKGFVLAPLPDHPTGDGSGGGGGGGSVPGSGTPDQRAFAMALLDRLGAPANDSTLTFLFGWFRREGTSATFNPLATTLDYGNNTKFNGIGVRNYADFDTGVAATAETLLRSGYPHIVADLRAGDGSAAGREHSELSRWSGGGYDDIPV